MSYPNPWYYKGQVFESEDIGKFYGMVYLLENTTNNKFYVGKKFFWSRVTRSVNGKKKKCLVESDWKKYHGSNRILKEEVAEHGIDIIRREILWLCETKTQCAYYELLEQVNRKALLRDDYYNDFIGGKITGRFLTEIKTDDSDDILKG